MPSSRLGLSTIDIGFMFRVSVSVGSFTFSDCFPRFLLITHVGRPINLLVYLSMVPLLDYENFALHTTHLEMCAVWKQY